MFLNIKYKLNLVIVCETEPNIIFMNVSKLNTMILLLTPPSKHSKNIVRDVFYGCWCIGKRIGGAQVPNLPLISIATCLEEVDKCVYIDASSSFYDFNEVIRFAENFDYIIFSSASVSITEDIEFIKEVKKLNPNLKTIVFGAFGTFLPERILDYDEIDFCVIGEPEFIILNLIKMLKISGDLKEIRGIAYNLDGKKIINEKEEFIKDLDEIPIPNREYISKYFYFNPLIRKKNWTTMMASRGCPEKCVFCASPRFYGNRTRSLSAERILQEIVYLKEIGYDEILFRDENFCQSKKKLKEICLKIIESNIKIDWICNSRVNSLTRSLISLMKKAGCHTIKFGVESGSQKILEGMNKRISLEQTKNAFKWCKDIGVRTHAHVILGGIGETKESINQTIYFVKKLGTDTATFNIMSPLPGTPLMDFVQQKLGKKMDGTDINFGVIHETPIYNCLFTNISNKYLGHALKKAYRKFYIRPSYIIRQLLKIRNLRDVLILIKSAFNVISFLL